MYDASSNKYTNPSIESNSVLFATHILNYSVPYRNGTKQSIDVNDDDDDDVAMATKHCPKTAVGVAVPMNSWHFNANRQPVNTSGNVSTSSARSVTDRKTTVSGSSSGVRRRQPSNTNSGASMMIKLPSNGLRLNTRSRSQSDLDTSQRRLRVVDDVTLGVGDFSSASEHSGVDANTSGEPYHTYSVTTTESTESSPSCGTPGDEIPFPVAAAAADRSAISSTVGQYRMMSLIDEYFPVTLGRGSNFELKPTRNRVSSASSASATADPSPRSSDSRTSGQEDQHRRHRRRHHQHHHHRHHRSNPHHNNDDAFEVQPLSSSARFPQNSQRRPGSGHSSGSSRSSIELFYGSAVSSSGDSITLNGGSTVLTSTPYQMELTRLRVERLRIEEERLLQLQTLEKVEMTRGPVNKWYELKTPQFHYEAHKNNRHIGASSPPAAAADFSSSQFNNIVRLSNCVDNMRTTATIGI